jgi:hypothetical protein
LQASKLWRFSQVVKSLAKRDLATAIKVGLESRLVTPVTAAIVYEPTERYWTHSWAREFKIHPRPGLDGVINSTPGVDWQIITAFPVCLPLNQAIDQAFQAVVSQLNNLSAASGTVASGSAGSFSSVSPHGYSLSCSFASPTSPQRFSPDSPMTPAQPLVDKSKIYSIVGSSPVFKNGTGERQSQNSSQTMAATMSDRTGIERGLQAWVTRVLLIALSLVVACAVVLLVIFGKHGRADTSEMTLARRLAVLVLIIAGAIVASQLISPAVRDLICLWG